MTARKDDRRPSRRALLAGTTASAAALWSAACARALAAPAGQDRASAIRLTGLRLYPIGGRVLLRLETNQGVVGWGEISQLVPQAAVALATSMFELLQGENPTRVEHLWQKVYRAHRDLRGGPFMVHTLSAFDMALWDITGKLHGVPVYRLLGGPCRDKIRIYPTPRAKKVGMGRPLPASSEPRLVEQMVATVRAARQAVGPDGAVMFDAHSCIPPATLIQFAGALAPSELLWIEEPAVPGNIEVFRRLKEQIRIPLATGERDRTIWETIPYLQNGVVDILQPDCAHGGGISQIRKIATLAEAYNVPLAPHSIAAFIGMTASLHAVAAIPNFLIHEHYPLGFDGILHKSWEIDADGYAALPEGPGLGVEVDEARLAKLPPQLRFRWPGYTYPDGSVADC